MEEQQAVLKLQRAFKESGIQTRKLPRSAALRVSFMDSFFRVTHAGEGKGWLVNGYNEDGDPVKLSELRSLCEELSPVAIAPATDEAAEVAIASPEPALGEELAGITPESPVADEAAEEAIGNSEPAQGEELAGITPKSPATDEIDIDSSGLFLESVKSVCVESGWTLSQTGEDTFDILVPEDEDGAIAPPTDQITGKALTLQQPWAWAITHLGKNIENRVWPTDYRGELYIHAGKGWDANGAAWIEQNIGAKVPPQSELAAGELVAKVNLVNCQHWTKTAEQREHAAAGSRNLWWQSFGYHWFLENIEVLETPIPLRGKLGIFTFSVVDPKVMDPCNVDSNAWCVANAPIADDEIIVDFGVPGTKIGGFTLLPTREDESAVRRRYLIGQIHNLARRTGVSVSKEESEILVDPEECPMADLEKLLNQLLTLPPVEAGIDWWQGHQSWWRSRQDDDPDDDGEPINYRPSAEMAS
ncbi:hypothetical protein [Laspinema palackyanum]|uniref:hypothetical protein n=1 Tax=Laspinema palackyanum TaxID=3231601 RepID=UPI00345CDA3A|nr:ASCH domain-containing protein [Laspinema sp. D2c]